MNRSDHSDDYVWHFKLREDDGPQQGSGDALTEMVREQIAALLSCVQLTSEGQLIRVTGFRFLDDPDREHLLGSSLADAASQKPNE